MTIDIFTALLNPAISLVLAGAFFLLWLNQRQRRHLVVLVIAYCAAAAGFLLQYFTLPIGGVATRLLSNLSFLSAGFCLAAAIINRYGRPVPWIALSLLCGGGFAVMLVLVAADAEFAWRIYAMSFALGGVSFVIAAELRAIPRKGPTEKFLIALALVAGLNFVVRTLVVVKMDPGAALEEFHTSLYWTTSMLSHALVSLLLALTLITAATLDVVTQLKSESNTDPLSGLLNRRGFEEAAMLALRQGAGSRVATALIIADLDHFKSVNDTFGHDVGDKVIIAFSQQVRQVTGGGAIAGRIGGEEFAVFLTATDLGSARLCAESLRTAFSQTAIAGVPREVKVTASFGVALLSGHEELSSLMRRADEALYHAKKGGRDRVRLSYQHSAAPADGRRMAG